MALARQQFGSILAECDPAVSLATLSAVDVVVHRIESAAQARLLARFWMVTQARCSGAMVQALHWIADRLEGCT